MNRATGACNSGKVSPVAANRKETGGEQNRGDVNDDMTGDGVWLLLHESTIPYIHGLKGKK